MDKQHGKEFDGFEERPKAKIHIDSFKATIKIYQTGKF